MRSLWTGAISFGLVNIPVKLYPGTEEEHLDLDMLHKKDLSPIRFARVCKQEGKEVPYKDIVKGFQIREGEYVVLEAEDFAAASPKKTKMIELETFTEAEHIDPKYFVKPYWLEPIKTASKPYALLRDALEQSGKVGIGKFVLRNRESLVVLRPDGDALTLLQLRFFAELRKPDELKFPSAKAVKSQLVMAKALIDQLSEPFNPKEHHDTYNDELKDLIAAKAKGKRPKTIAKVPATHTKVVDLVALLKKSLGDAPSKKTRKAA